MIEFKAECGHTVRARDEDKGKPVRCSYCGRVAKVPDEQQRDDIDFLLRDIEQTTPPEEPAPRRKRGRFAKTSARFAGGGRRVEFNPLGVVLRMVYAAVLLSIVIIVVTKVVMPLMDRGGRSNVVRQPSTPAEQTRSSRQHRSEPPKRTKGLTALEGEGGLYVESVPEGATIYYLPQDHASRTGLISESASCASSRVNGPLPRISPGTYVVELWMRWNDPNLTRYPGYTEFRRSLERATDTESRRLIGEYFLPDEAVTVLAHRGTDDQLYLVRQYRDVVVREGEWQAVRGLFLPRLSTSDRRGYAVEQVVQGFVAGLSQRYVFDATHARSELDYYEVPQADQALLLDALARIGVAPYVTPDGKTRLFKISVQDGMFAARTLN